MKYWNSQAKEIMLFHPEMSQYQVSQSEKKIAFYKDKQVPFWSILLAPKKRGWKIYSCIPNIITCNWTTMIITVLFRYSVYFPYLILFNMLSTTTCKNWEQPRTPSQGSPHIVKTGQVDFSLSWHKGDERENLRDFRKLIHYPMFPYLSQKRTCCTMILKRME